MRQIENLLQVGFDFLRTLSKIAAGDGEERLVGQSQYIIVKSQERRAGICVTKERKHQYRIDISLVDSERERHAKRNFVSILRKKD